MIVIIIRIHHFRFIFILIILKNLIHLPINPLMNQYNLQNYYFLNFHQIIWRKFFVDNILLILILHLQLLKNIYYFSKIHQILLN